MMVCQGRGKSQGPGETQVSTLQIIVRTYHSIGKQSLNFSLSSRSCLFELMKLFIYFILFYFILFANQIPVTVDDNTVLHFTLKVSTHAHTHFIHYDEGQIVQQKIRKKKKIEMR